MEAESHVLCLSETPNQGYIRLPSVLTDQWEIGLVNITYSNLFIENPDQIYVCCDAINSDYNQVLRHIPHKALAARGNQKHYDFPNIVYLSVHTPLNKSRLTLTDEEGELVSFTSKAKVIYTLHLRKKYVGRFLSEAR